MGLATDVSIVQETLFNLEEGVDVATVERLPVEGIDVYSVVNWGRLRAALQALNRMGWYQVRDYWSYYLDEGRFPIGFALEFSPEESNRFQGELSLLREQTTEGIGILGQVLPRIPLGDVSASLVVGSPSEMAEAFQHVDRVLKLCSVNDALSVTSDQSGSLELTFGGDPVSSKALELAVYLSRLMLGPVVENRVREFMDILKKVRGDGSDVEEEEEEKARETVAEKVGEEFWDGVGMDFDSDVGVVGGHAPAARNQVNQAATTIATHSARMGVNWNPPNAVVHGLAGGAWVELNYADPRALGRVIRELAAPPDDDFPDFTMPDIGNPGEQTEGEGVEEQ